MNKSGIAFAEQMLRPDLVRGKTVIEVGARDVNGSVRPYLESLHPASYLGVDIEPGPCVDEVCRVEDIAQRYGAFDIVVSTELVEHVKDWRAAFDNMKHVLGPGGLLLVTTRSVGFKVHGYPYDFWRYQLEDMRVILADLAIVALETDSQAPGVFVLARKPTDWEPLDLSRIELYSVVKRRRVRTINSLDTVLFMVRYRAHMLYRRVLPERLRARVKRIAQP